MTEELHLYQRDRARDLSALLKDLAVTQVWGTEARESNLTVCPHSFHYLPASHSYTKPTSPRRRMRQTTRGHGVLCWGTYRPNSSSSNDTLHFYHLKVAV